VSQTSSHSSLATTLTYINQFWSFLAEMLLRKQAVKRCFFQLT